MIKINLNKTKGTVNTYHTKSTGLATRGESVLTNIFKSKDSVPVDPLIVIKAVINIVLVLSFPLGLKVYEVHQINKLDVKKQKVEQLLNKTNQKLSQTKTKLESYSYLKTKSEEFTKKKEVLKKLAGERLVIPRVIDLIQSKTPKTVWLKSLKMELSDQGKVLKLSGSSFNEAYINFFATSLHDILDQDSITVDTRDIKEGNSVVKVDFNLQGVM